MTCGDAHDVQGARRAGGARGGDGSAGDGGRGRGRGGARLPDGGRRHGDHGHPECRGRAAAHPRYAHRLHRPRRAEVLRRHPGRQDQRVLLGGRRAPARHQGPGLRRPVGHQRPGQRRQYLRPGRAPVLPQRWSGLSHRRLRRPPYRRRQDGLSESGPVLPGDQPKGDGGLRHRQLAGRDRLSHRARAQGRHPGPAGRRHMEQCGARSAHRHRQARRQGRDRFQRRGVGRQGRVAGPDQAGRGPLLPRTGGLGAAAQHQRRTAEFDPRRLDGRCGDDRCHEVRPERARAQPLQPRARGGAGQQLRLVQRETGRRQGVHRARRVRQPPPPDRCGQRDAVRGLVLPGGHPQPGDGAVLSRGRGPHPAGGRPGHGTGRARLLPADRRFLRHTHRPGHGRQGAARPGGGEERHPDGGGVRRDRHGRDAIAGACGVEGGGAAQVGAGGSGAGVASAGSVASVVPGVVLPEPVVSGTVPRNPVVPEAGSIPPAGWSEPYGESGRSMQSVPGQSNQSGQSGLPNELGQPEWAGRPGRPPEVERSSATRPSLPSQAPQVSESSNSSHVAEASQPSQTSQASASASVSASVSPSSRTSQEAQAAQQGREAEQFGPSQGW